jgi:hypothetical protein
MIVTIVSIAEAMLYDFIARIQSREWVSTLPSETIADIKSKTYGQLTRLIDGARKHALFEADSEFYQSLDDLRKLRNRVHIQNEKDHFERNEATAYSAERLQVAERALELIAKTLADKHPRGPSTRGFVKDFEFPWEEHYK